MSIIKGIVTNVEAVSKRSKAGKPFKVHYISVNCDGGSVVRVNVGFKNVYTDGQVVTLDVQEKYGELQLVADASGGATVPGASSPTPPSNQTYARSAGGRPFPVPKDSGEFSIIRQSALKAAIDTVHHHALKGGVVPDDLDAYSEMIIKLAYKYTDFSSGHRELNHVAALKAKE